MATKDGWQEIKLGEVIEIFDHKRIPLSGKQRSEKQGKYPYYGASGIIDYVDGFLFDGEYILVSEDGENLKSRRTPIAFLARGRFWVNNHAHIIKALPGRADDYFLMRYIENLNLLPYITGTAQPKLSQANLKAIQIEIPSVETQRKITKILSAYDRLIENNTRRIKILEEMARSLYDEWFVKFRFPGHEQTKFVDSELGLIPEDWEVKNFGEVSLNFDRKRIPLSSIQRSKRQGEYRYYGASGVIDYIDDYIFDGKYLLIAEDGENLNSRKLPIAFLASGKFWVNNHAHIVQGKSPVSSELLCLFMQALDISGYITGAAQPKLSQSNLNRIPFILPSEQLLNQFNEVACQLLNQVENLHRKNQNLQKTRDLLLPKLISGEIDVEKLDGMGGEGATIQGKDLVVAV